MRGTNHVPTIPPSARRFDLYRVTLELISVCQPLCAKMKRLNHRLGAQLCVPEHGEPYALMRMHTVTLVCSDRSSVLPGIAVGATRPSAIAIETMRSRQDRASCWIYFPLRRTDR